ncbi:MAG: hypothetical protein KA352_16655, partial [Flavobacteriales bacterium]|nr:hypothetical protein [Flavobacteriales bacterium]
MSASSNSGRIGRKGSVVENFLPDFLAIDLVRWLIVRRVLDRISVGFDGLVKPARQVSKNNNSKTTEHMAIEINKEKLKALQLTMDKMEKT